MAWTAENLAETKIAILEARASGLWARYRNALVDAENQNGVPSRDGRLVEEAAKTWGAAAIEAERAGCAELVRAHGCHCIPFPAATADPTRFRVVVDGISHKGTCPLALAVAIERREEG